MAIFESMNSQNRKLELEAFKGLNLSVVASDFGYGIVKAKSTRHSALMKSSSDKIIVCKNGSHYVYCSVFDSGSNGTIIDLVQKVIEPGCSLGRVRQILRPFLDGNHFSAVMKKHEGQFVKTISPSSFDLLAVAARYSEFEPITKPLRYLCDERKIPFSLLQHDRLIGRVRFCPKRNSVIFPHHGSSDGDTSNLDRCITGYEIKSPNVNMFSKSGRKGLWASAGYSQDRILAVAESGLDALSYLALHDPEITRVLSISGQLNSHQPYLIQSAIDQMKEGSQVVAAFDNDEAGDELTEKLAELFEDCDRNDIGFRENRPQIRGDDWNAILKKDSKASISADCFSI